MTSRDKKNALIDIILLQLSRGSRVIRLVINNHVKWNNHINKIANNIAMTNGILNRLKHFLAPGILVNIYNCLILPHL